MSVEKLKEIRELESTSDEIIKNAEKEAEKIIQESNVSAENIIRKGKEEANKHIEEINKKYQDETEEEISNLDKEASSRKNQLRQSKKDHIDDATVLIIRNITE